MEDLDAALMRIRTLPLDARLDTIDDAVIAGLQAQPGAGLTAPALAAVAAVSLAIGLGGSLVPAAPRPAAPSAILVASADLAPSTLLGGAE